MPSYFFFDSSALVKCYHTELGSLIAQRLFDTLRSEELSRIVASSLIVSETVSVITRKHHRNEMTLQSARSAQVSLIAESRRMMMGPLDDTVVYQSMSYITRYNLNASDALYLYQAIWLQHILTLQDETNNIIFVTSDKRLLHAAQSENLLTLNAETASADDVQVLLF